MTTFDDLPMPSPAEQRRSDALRDHLHQLIDQHHGFISFSTFMNQALYHPQFGYYQADTMEIGRTGDFITAPEISPLFGQCLAHQCAQLFQTVTAPQLLEIGAGTGKLASDLLLTLDQLGALPDRYYIVEISKILRQKQQRQLSQTIPALMNRLVWLDTLPAQFNGIIIANEVLDALPVDCFHVGTPLSERGVGWDNGQLVWRLATPASPQLLALASQYCQTYHLPTGYTSEIPAALPAFIQSLANRLTQGVVLLADYGYGRAEYYHPERRHGTLTCFYQHHRHDNPLRQPGLQDITAHVDFTLVAEQATDHDLSLIGYTSQAAFLLGCGLLDLAAKIEKDLTPSQIFTLHQAIKTLTLPTEMGERIKIMALGKDVGLPPLIGFRLQDRRREL